MHPGVAFVLYLAVGSIVIFMFLLLCVRISVFIEDTCPMRFCLKRKQRKMRKTLIRRMLYPDVLFIEPDSPRPAPPSDENITADIICQPYIYRDAYSTGLTGLSMLANLPLTVAYTSDGNPSDAIVTSSEQMRITFRRLLPQVSLTLSQDLAGNQEDSTDEITMEDHDSDRDSRTRDDDEEAAPEIESLPPEYCNLANISIDNENETKSGRGTQDNDDNELEEEEPPPPSYYECVISKNQSGTN